MFTVTITAITEEAAGVKTFTVSRQDGQHILYAAGQFLTFVFSHHGREERRSFSISSSPGVDELPSFTVKRVDNGAYSRLLIDRAKVGDTLFTTGAAGLFTLPETIRPPKQVFFFAAGIGITPVYSLIKTLLRSQPGVSVILVYSNRSREEVVFYDELNELASHFPDTFKIEYLYSTSFDLARARLNKALLPVLLTEYGSVPKEDMFFYVCGPFSYMRMVIFSLEEQGIRDAQIRRENFNTNNYAVKMPEPPDKASHSVTIRTAGTEHIFTVQYPDSILQAARKNGLSLPYSCEVGRCGSCAALCTSGKTWLSYNEVLMNNDLEKGMTLTCVAHPVGGDVEIEI